LKQVDSAHQGAITVIIPSPYGKVITSGGADGVIRSWDQATLLPQGKPISAHRAAVTAIAYSPNGTTVATAGADKTLRLWGGDGMALPSVSPALSSPASFLGFTPAGQLLVGTADHRLEIRDSRPDGEAQPSPANPSNSLSPDGDLWGRIQSLPPNTWWILLAVPGGLFLLGLLGAFLGTKRQPEVGNQSASPDLPSGAVPSQPLPGAEMGIDFSGIGQKPSVDQALSLPPEASLIPPTAAVAEPASPGQLEQARSQLVEGKRLMREQRCDLALIHFNSAIEATELERLNTTASGAPISGVNVIAAQAQAHRGNALLQMEQLAEAMESYNIALGFDTTNLEAWLGKGRLLTKLERYEEALFCFDSALELDKTAIAAWSGKAEVLMQLGRQAEAQTCVDRVVSLGGEFSRPLPLITGPITTGLVPDPPIDVTPPATAGLPSVSPAYDPDVPMELQQMVQVLPSGDSGSSPAITPTILPDLAAVAQLPDQADIPEVLAAAVAQLPDQADVPEVLAAAVAQLPDQADVPEVLAAIGEASPPFPLSLEEQLLGQVSLSAVLPSTIQDSPSPEATEPGAPPLVQASDSPLEAAIENSSYGFSNQPSPTLSWVKLSIDQAHPDRFYAQWHIDDGDRTTARHQGGQTLALRLYDVTGQGTDTPLAGPVQEQRCDDLAQDWYLPIPQWDRIYLAAVGYVGDGDSWHTIAQSPELAAISG
ncbi:MAG: DUF4912 domain-containing protein, partial [Nodosilinea sp.]